MYRTSSRLMTALIAVCTSPALVATAEAQGDAPAIAHTHMAFTSERPGTAADTGRALAVVQALKGAVSPYQTLDQAKAAGYRARRDPATVMEGKLLHVGKRPKAASEQADFDPKAPQALLLPARLRRPDAPGRGHVRGPSLGHYGRSRRHDSAQRGALASAYECLPPRRSQIHRAPAQRQHRGGVRGSGGPVPHTVTVHGPCHDRRRRRSRARVSSGS